MEHITINSLTVLRGLLKDELFLAFIKAKEHEGEDTVCSYYGEFFSKLYSAGAECDFAAYVSNAVLTDENAFSRCCAAGKAPSPFLINAYLNDIDLIFGYIAEPACKQGEYFAAGKPLPVFDRSKGAAALVARLKKFYKKHGCGMFIKHRAFGYSDGELIPIENPSRITLAELKGYTLEKRTIESNILSFLHGLPYGNMLLYGDRGTGKSSTVHAMLNRYFESGLRIVELNKENMLDLPKLRQILSSNPLRFIIFIDDLSLNEGDDKISGLKAALEGSVAGKTDNTMIVATSNRRHIVKESLSDRENSVHVNDSLQEQLSLSDRFGITVLFSSTGKAEYLSIVAGLCADYKIEYNEHIADLAERWALSKGGRSPRRARQFADLALSCIKKHEEIGF